MSTAETSAKLRCAITNEPLGPDVVVGTVKDVENGHAQAAKTRIGVIRADQVGRFFEAIDTAVRTIQQGVQMNNRIREALGLTVRPTLRSMNRR